MNSKQHMINSTIVTVAFFALGAVGQGWLALVVLVGYIAYVVGTMEKRQ